jgi:cell division protein FtsQ
MLLLGAVRSKEEKLCSGVDIKIGITEQKGFIDEKEVAALIKEIVGHKPQGSAIKQFNLRKTESGLEQNVWIKKAQMFFDNKQLLHVHVEQRIPVARMIEQTGASYYLDSTGFKLPLSKTDRADVPVFTSVPNKMSNSFVKNIVNMSLCIVKDSFWLAQAAQIDVLPEGKFELYPVVGNHVIELGNASQIENKLNRLKAFYKNVSTKKGFDAYSKINVAYDRQVIAVRRDSSAPSVDKGKAIRVFDQIVKANRSKANEEQPIEEKKPAIIKSEIKIEKAIKPLPEKPPDIKNKGNPAVKSKKESAVKPKALMPKAHHN